MSSLVVAFGYARLVAAVAIAVVQSIFTLIACPLRVAYQVLDLLYSIGTSIFNWLNANALLAIGLVVALAFFIFVAPFGISATSELIETENIVWECAVQPAWEFADRAVLRNVVEFYERASAFVNLALEFIFAQAAPRIVTSVELAQCALDGGSFAQLFDIPFQLWGIVGAIPFSFVGAPRATRTEPVPPGEYGYHFPRTANVLPQDGRFEWNPEYDAQGPAGPAEPYFSLRFFVRNAWGQLAYVIDDFGLLVTRIVSHLGRPADRLVPALIVDTDVEMSLWREVGDLTCRVAEFVALAPIYGYSNTVTPVQTGREDFTGYACQSLRKITCLGGQLSLVLVDLTTRNRPLPIAGGTCDPAAGMNGPPNPASFEDYFRGFPLIDLFLPGGNPNVNLFRSNINFCEFQSGQPGNNCGGLARGSYSYIGFPSFTECPEWNGQAVPLITERINYIGRFVDCIADLIDVFFQLETVADAPLGGSVVSQVSGIVTSLLNLIIDDVLFVVNTFFSPGCNPIAAISTWVGDRLGGVIIETLEFAFQDSCAAGVKSPQSQDNIFLCFIALSSRASPGTFWSALCGIIDTVEGVIQPLVDNGFDLRCAARKRSAAEQFAAPPDRATQLSIGQRVHLGAAFYAYQTRAALGAFDYCLLDPDTSLLVAPRCASDCALRPCVDDALQCVADRLGADKRTADNYWRGAAAHDSYWASAARGLALAADTAVGCRDGDAARFAETLNATAAVVHDAALRTAFAAQHYATAHDRCLDEARAAPHATDGDTAAYLRCVGLPPEPAHDAATGAERSALQRYRATLLRHGVARDASRCSELLHRFGVLFDRLELDAANAEHEHYRACSTLLAYGARARSLGNTGEPLANYLDGWRMPLALTVATEYAPDAELRAVAATERWRLSGSPAWRGERTDRRWLDSLLEGGNALIDAQHRFELTGDALAAENGAEASQRPYYRTSSGRKTRSRPRHPSLLSAHKVASAAYAYFNYLADVYEHVVLVPSDGAEKDALAQQLWTRHMVPTSLAIVGRTSAATQAHVELGARLRSAARRGANVREVARIFAHSLRWVDRLHTVVDNSASHGVAMTEGMAALRNGTGAMVEFALEQRPVGGVSMARPSPALEPVLAMRVLRADRQLATTLVLADRQNEPEFADMRASVALRRERMDPFARVHLRELAGALQAASRSIELRRSPEQRAQVTTALKALDSLDRNLTAAALDGRALAERVGFGSLGALRMVLRVAWNVVNWRLQLHKLPPVQAASAVIDTLVSGRHDALRDWLAHRQQYVAGVGYVSNAQYDTYMALDEWRRGDSEPASLELADGRVVSDTGRFMLLSAVNARAARVRRRIVPELARARLLRESLRNEAGAADAGAAAAASHEVKLALPGDSIYSRWLRTRRQALLRPRVNFRHRARYLVRAGYAHTDAHTAHVAGAQWQHHAAALAATHDNATHAQRIAVAQMAAAEIQNTEFWLGQWDTLFATLGSDDAEAVSGTADSLLDQLADAITDLIDDIADTGSGLLDAFLAAIPCDPAQDYRAGGTGLYKLGCVPFLPERLFDWYIGFPVPRGPEFVPPTALRFGGQLNFFTGPGYLQFPSEMLAPGGDCPTKRDPEQVAPLPFIGDAPITFFSLYEQTNACREPGPTPPSRPLCNTLNCDYCARTWLNADEAGFTDGVRNIEVWSGAVRELLRNVLLPQAAGGYLFVLIFYTLTQFVNFSQIGLTFAFSLLAFYVGEVHVLQAPERAFYAYALITLPTIATPFFGTLFAFAYAVNLYPVYVLGRPDALFGQALFDAISFLLPDNLIDLALRIVVLPLDAFVGAFVDTGITAAVEPLQLRLAASIGGAAPSIAELRYSLYSVYNVFILAVFASAYIALVALAAYAAVQLLACLLGIVGNFYNVYLTYRAFLVRRRVAKLEETQDVVENSIDELASANETLFERVLALTVNDEQFHRETQSKLGELRQRQRKTEEKID